MNRRQHAPLIRHRYAVDDRSWYDRGSAESYARQLATSYGYAVPVHRIERGKARVVVCWMKPEAESRTLAVCL